MPRNATFATLLTRVAYLPGTLVLDWTLRMVGSQYPLVVMVNPSLPKDARDVLASRKIKVVEVDDLRPEEGAYSLGGHDMRFKDTWTKLRCELFSLTQTVDDRGVIFHRAFDLCDYEVRVSRSQYQHHLRPLLYISASGSA